MFLKVIKISICFKLSFDKKCDNCDNLGLQINVLPMFRFYHKYSNDLSHFASFTFTYSLFVEKIAED